MYLLPLEIVGLFSVNCYEGGLPCGSQTDAKKDILDIVKELECADKYEVSDECKALVKSSEQRFIDAVNAFVKTGEDLNFRWDRWENTLLHVAAKLGYKNALIALLENGARPDEGCKYGYTPLIQAASEGQVDMVKILLKHGASVNAENTSGATALIFAAEKGHNEVAEILLDSGSNINKQDSLGLTPLIFAAQEGNTKLVTMLLERGALPNLKTIPRRAEDTAIIKAASNGHKDVVSALLLHGADVDAANNRGITGLFWASKHGHTDIVSMLLANGASVDGKMPKESPLMVASEKGNEDIVALLIKNGANPKIKGSYRNTALDYARYGGYTKIEKMIEEYLKTYE